MTLEDVGPDDWRHCVALQVEMTLLIYPVVVGQGTCLIRMRSYQGEYK